MPVQVTLEGFNPLIPLDTANSSIPCAIFRLTARNTGQQPVGREPAGDAAERGRQPGGRAAFRACDSAATAAIATAWSASRDWSAVAMDKSPDPMQSGPVKVRSAAGPEVDGPELLWLAGVGGFTPQAAEALADIVADGGVVLADGLQPGLLRGRRRACATSPSDVASLATVFEDFEKKSYEGWTTDRRRLRQAAVARHRSAASSRSAVSPAAGWSTRSSRATVRRARPPRNRSASSGVTSAS